jgi:hypothetical protein
VAVYGTPLGVYRISVRHEQSAAQGFGRGAGFRLRGPRKIRLTITSRRRAAALLKRP